VLVRGGRLFSVFASIKMLSLHVGKGRNLQARNRFVCFFTGKQPGGMMTFASSMRVLATHFIITSMPAYQHPIRIW
jgi:hypothetical protein